MVVVAGGDGVRLRWKSPPPVPVLWWVVAGTGAGAGAGSCRWKRELCLRGAAAVSCTGTTSGEGSRLEPKRGIVLCVLCSSGFMALSSLWACVAVCSSVTAGCQCCGGQVET